MAARACSLRELGGENGHQSEPVYWFRHGRYRSQTIYGPPGGLNFFSN
jgi:hypothetical protein